MGGSGEREERYGCFNGCVRPLHSSSARWSEYFQKLPNIPGDIEPNALENIQQLSVNTVLDEKLIMDEMVTVINGLKDGKAAGGDRIPAEVWKYRKPICPTDCTDGSPKYGVQMWKDASIVTIYKKGHQAECGNYRCISLLSTAGKIFARILLNILSSHITPKVVADTQCDFH